MATEILGNFDNKESNYDMYLGFAAGFDLKDNMNISVVGRFFFDLNSDTELKPWIDLYPAFTFSMGKHSFSAGVDVELCDGDSIVCFPLVWKYSL